MPKPVFRFAPSPNGYLHLGHAYSALLNFDLARKARGRLLLRIEDIDQSRCRPEYEAAIYEDLAWLGIRWEEPVRRQSEHMAVYGAALGALEAQGVVYASFESRAEISRMVAAKVREKGSWPRDPDGTPLFPGGPDRVPEEERKRRVEAGEPYALRLNMAAVKARTRALSWREEGQGPDGETGKIAAKPALWGDFVLARKEMATSYHVSVVADDAIQGVTHIVRGQDLFAATSVHRLLQKLLDVAAPRYHHHRLILDADGRKLSKSTQATSLRSLRDGGATPADIRRMVGLESDA
jgi:glutamyl-Q tRNA(Asp) synthetase